MKDKEIRNIWKQDNSGIEDKLNFIVDEIIDQKTDKTKSTLRGLLIRRILEATIFMILFFVLLKFMIFNPGLQYISAGLILAIFTAVGYIGSINQIKSILQLDYNAPVTVFQDKLERIKAYSLWTLRLIFMSIPFYFAYVIIGFKVFFGTDILSQGDQNWIIANIIMSALLIVASIWFYRNINLRSESKWVNSLIRDNGGREIHSAMQFIKEIDDFKRE